MQSGILLLKAKGIPNVQAAGWNEYWIGAPSVGSFTHPSRSPDVIAVKVSRYLGSGNHKRLAAVRISLSTTNPVVES